MPQKSSDRKSSRRNPQDLDLSPSAGPDGVAIAPPTYGIGFLDYAAAQAEAEPSSNGGLTLQRKADPSTSGDDTNEAPPLVHEVLRSPGQPLDARTRAFMEPRFGHDFSGVRVHTDEKAAQSAQAVNALAYTVGRDVVFGSGQYQPQSSPGVNLLAHELAHVALASPSARSATPFPALPVMAENSIDEQAAHALAEGQPLSKSFGEPPAVRRAATTEASMVMSVAPPKANSLVPPPTAAALALSPTASFEEIVDVMRVIDAISPSGVASGLFTTNFKGHIITLTFQQVDQVRAGARKALKGALARVLNQRDQALGRYRSQEQINKEFPMTSRAVKAYAWISSLGNYSNPGESVYGQSDIVTAKLALAHAALAKDSFAEAIYHVSEADIASERTSILVHAYIDQLVSGGENLATGLTFTRDAAFVTVGVLAVIVSGGAALGLGAGVVGTGVGGLSVAGTATAVSVGAPIIANLGVVGEKIVEGDRVDLGQVAVDTAVQVLLARFGGKLSAGIASKIVGAPATQTLARQAIASLVSGSATHVVSQAFTVTVSSVYESFWNKKDVTWHEIVNALITSLSDPVGWFMVALGSGVHLGAQVKVANAVRAQASAPEPASTPAPAKAAEPTHPAVAQEPLSKAQAVAPEPIPAKPIEMAKIPEPSSPKAAAPEPTHPTPAKETPKHPSSVPSEGSGLELDLSGSREGWNMHLEEYQVRESAKLSAEVKKPGFGEASTEKGGTEHHTGMSFHEYSAAEVAIGLRVDWDPQAGRPRKVTYNFTAAAAAVPSQATERSFHQEPRLKGESAQSREKAYVKSGMERGHLAQREAGKVDANIDAALGLKEPTGPEVERSLDVLTNVAPMTPTLNKGNPWRSAETRTAQFAVREGYVTVEITPIYDPKPPRLSDGTPIPSKFRRMIKSGPTGKVLEDITFDNK